MTGGLRCRGKTHWPRGARVKLNVLNLILLAPFLVGLVHAVEVGVRSGEGVVGVGEVFRIVGVNVGEPGEAGEVVEVPIWEKVHQSHKPTHKGK